MKQGCLQKEIYGYYLFIVTKKGGIKVKTLKPYCCTIPSDLNCICSTVKHVLDYLHEAAGCIEESNEFEIKVILNELLINAIKHGNRQEVGKNIKLRAKVSKDDELSITIEDEGEGFDYCCQNSVHAATGDDNCFELDETGRGIFIVKNLCEKVRFNIKGNKIEILKKILKEDVSH